MERQSLDPALVETPIGMLAVGHYVAAVDRPWLETPFAVQGFFIETEDDIDYVAEHCEFVFIDPRRVERKKPGRATSIGPRNTISLKAELPQAKVDFESASVVMDRVFREIKANRIVNVAAIRATIDPLIQSVLRNNEALAALVRMKEKNEYIHSHCIATAVWATLLARHMGFGADDLRTIAMGAAMIDIGMVNVPNHIVNKPEPLTEEEFKLVKSHVRGGLRMLDESGVVDHRIIEIVECHHERHSGAGYPNGLAGSDIPITARMVGIADVYDSMVTDRPYRDAYSSFEAIQELTDLKGSFFHPDVTEAFTQAVGIFPTGSIVELNSGEVGIVVAQNSIRRLKPQLIIVLNKEKEPYQRFVTKNLATPGQRLRITREIKPGTYDINPEQYFL